jgi:hypothetical protein
MVILAHVVLLGRVWGGYFGVAIMHVNCVNYF